MSKSRDHVSNSYTINKVTTFFRVKNTLFFCFKQLALIFNLILELFIHISFEQALTFAI